MIWKTVFGNALAALTFYKRRSIVTVISLAWAVASFLILMSYGDGFETALRSAFRAVGQDLVFMTGGQTSLQTGGMRAGRNIRLEEGDADTVRQNVPLVAAVSPELMMTTSVAWGNREKQYMLRAVIPEYARIRNMRLDAGRWLNTEDDHQSRRVAVVGATVARELFGTRRFLNETIIVNGVSFTVIGRLATKVQIANYNRPDNECVFLPYHTMSLFKPTRHPDDIVWTPVTPGARERAVKQVRAVLAGLHRFSPKDEKAVMLLEFSKFTSIVDGMVLALEILLAFIGTVTLAIGGVGLANIMFASVLERTTEIGVHKALGATRRVVLFQFICEAAVIVLLGAVCGVALGWGVAHAVGSLPFLGNLAGRGVGSDYGRIHFVVSGSSVLVSCGVLLLVGFVAGVLPAVRAARMDPIRALRYE